MFPTEEKSVLLLRLCLALISIQLNGALDCRVTWVHDLGAVGQAKRSLIGPYYDLLPNMHHPLHHPYIFVAEAICTLLIKNQRDHSNSAER